MNQANKIILQLVGLLCVVVLISVTVKYTEGYQEGLTKKPADELRDYNSTLNFAKANKDLVQHNLENAMNDFNTDMGTLLNMINSANKGKVYNPHMYDVYNALKGLKDALYNFKITQQSQKNKDALTSATKKCVDAIKALKDKAMIQLATQIQTKRIETVITYQQKLKGINEALLTLPGKIADLIKRYPHLAPTNKASGSGSGSSKLLTGYGSGSTQSSSKTNLPTGSGKGSSIIQDVPGFPEYKFKGCWTKGQDTKYQVLNGMAIPNINSIATCASKAKALNLSTIAYDGSSNGMCQGGEGEYKNTTSADCTTTYGLGKSFAVYSKIP